MLKPITLISAAAMLFAAAVVPAIADTPMESSHMHSTMMGHHGKGHGGHHGMMGGHGKWNKGGHGPMSWGKGHGKIEHGMMGGKGHGHGKGMMGHPKPTM